MAMNGDASTIRIGNTLAAASSHTAGRRGTVISDEDKSTTGSSVIADIVQSETIATCTSIAAKTGKTSGATNAISARRRSGVRGHIVSAMACRLSRVTASEMVIGAAR